MYFPKSQKFGNPWHDPKQQATARQHYSIHIIESFPTNIVANAFSFKKADFFEIEDPSARELPKVEF